MKLLCTLLFFLLLHSTQGQQLVINELMASNNSTLADKEGDYNDWIEIYNNDIQAVNLAGYGLSDNHGNRFKWMFPNVTIQPGEYLLIWASGKDRNNPSHPLHTNFSISASGEPISLTKHDGTLLDYVPEIQLPTDVSYGRYPNAKGAFHYFYKPTPNTANTTTGLSELLTAPVFSHDAGFYNTSVNLSITHTNPNISIIYTLDGSEPKLENVEGKTYQYLNSYPNGSFLDNSIQTYIYNAPLLINDRSNQPNKLSAISTTQDSNPRYLPGSPVKKATVVKARTVLNGVEGPMKAATFFISNNNAFNFNNLPLISLSFNEDDLFEYNDGIYVAGKDFATSSGARISGYGNYNRRGTENEKKTYFEFFENRNRVVNLGVGLRITGNFSRKLAFKGTRIAARSGYDYTNIINHRFFDVPVPLASEDVTQFKGLVMKGPNSYDFAFSELFHGVFEGVLGRIQPAIQFFNGELWGLTMLRDRFDANHLFNNYGINPDNVVIIKIGYGWDVGQPGQEHLQRVWYVNEGVQSDLDKFFDMKNFIVTNDMSNPVFYELAKQRIDVESYVNHLILKMFAGDDHYAPELVFWKTRIAESDGLGDGRWRVFIKDFDAATTLTNNMVQSLAQGTHPRSFGAEIFTSLLKNEEFKLVFINRFADLLNTYLNKQRFDQIIKGVFDTLIPIWAEVSGGRWGSASLSNPSRVFNTSNRNALLNWSNIHPARQRDHIRDYFKIPGNQNITLNVSEFEHGHIKINTIDIGANTSGLFENPYPWSGIYFHGIPIAITAIPANGFKFSHWSGSSASTDNSISLTPTTDLSLTANFVPDPGTIESELLLHYWLMDNNLANDTPLDTMAATYTIMSSGAQVEYQSCLVGYPFNNTHPNWRKASMERRNSPTPLNYNPEANKDLAFGTFIMMGLQIKQPFHDNGNENILYLNFSTQGHEKIKLSFAVKDEGAADAIIAEYWDDQKNQWTSAFLPAILYDIRSSYQVVEIDFSNVAVAANNPNFQCRLRFHGINMTADNGDRVTINNIAVIGKELVAANNSDKPLDNFSYYPNPTTGKIVVSYLHEVEEIILYNLLGQAVLIEKSNKSSFTLDLSHLPPATFLMEIKTRNQSFKVKVLKR